MIHTLIFFLFLAAVIITPQVLRSQDRRRMYDTLRTAYERGVPVPPEVLDAMTRGRPLQLDAGDAPAGARPVQSRDLRRGVILVSLGVGLLLIGAAFYAGLYEVGGAGETLAAFAAGGAVPFCIGVAYLGLWWFGGGRKPRA